MMTVIDLDRQAADLAYVEQLIVLNPMLQATNPHVYIDGQDVWVEVEGSHREVWTWRHAINGRIFPHSVDRHGAWRQHIASTRVSVLVINHFQSRGI